MNQLPSAASEAILEEIKKWGAIDVETGGFLLLSSEGILTIAFTADVGIERHPLRLAISDASIAQLFVWASENNYRVIGQFHSHKESAHMSFADRHGGFRFSNFISTIVPYYLDPPADHSAWGWWQFDGQSWVEVAAPKGTRAETRIVYFDELGVK